VFDTESGTRRQFVVPEGRRSLAGKITPRLSQSQFNRSGIIAEDIGTVCTHPIVQHKCMSLTRSTVNIRLGSCFRRPPIRKYA
jgi:hypothetical protein